MTLITRYYPPIEDSWQGRHDAPQHAYIFQVIQLLDIQNQQIPTHQFNAIAFIGFCCDEGVRRNLGRIGAVMGPPTLREFIAKLPVQRNDITIYDAGDIHCDDHNLEESQQALGNLIATLLKHGIVPFVLGGGHEVAFGNYLGIQQAYNQEKLGIINFDAHFDLRPLLPDNKGSSGTPFLQIAHLHKQNSRSFDYNCIGIQPSANTALLFDTATKNNVNILTAENLYLSDRSQHQQWLDQIIDRNQILYLSLCLDVFAAPYAPGVSAPQPLGVTPWQLLPLVTSLASSGKIISYDIAEFAPNYDKDHRTARLAASFIHSIIHHHQPYLAGSSHAN